MFAYLHRHIIGVFVGEDALEITDHGYKAAHTLQGAGFETEFSPTCHYFKYGQLVFIGKNHYFFDGGFADAANGIVNNPLQRLFVKRIYGYPQISQQIFDFFALVKTNTAIYATGNSHPA